MLYYDATMVASPYYNALELGLYVSIILKCQDIPIMLKIIQYQSRRKQILGGTAMLKP